MNELSQFLYIAVLYGITAGTTFLFWAISKDFTFDKYEKSKYLDWDVAAVLSVIWPMWLLYHLSLLLKPGASHVIKGLLKLISKTGVTPSLRKKNASTELIFIDMVGVALLKHQLLGNTRYNWKSCGHGYVADVLCKDIEVGYDEILTSYIRVGEKYFRDPKVIKLFYKKYLKKFIKIEEQKAMETIAYNKAKTYLDSIEALLDIDLSKIK